MSLLELADRAMAGRSIDDERVADVAHFRWRVGNAEHWLEARFLPSATRADVEKLYPGVHAVPLPDADQRGAVSSGVDALLVADEDGSADVLGQAIDQGHRRDV